MVPTSAIMLNSSESSRQFLTPLFVGIQMSRVIFYVIEGVRLLPRPRSSSNQTVGTFPILPAFAPLAFGRPTRRNIYISQIVREGKLEATSLRFAAARVDMDVVLDVFTVEDM